MYFESRTYEIKELSPSYKELVSNIENSSGHEVHSIINKQGNQIAFVPDGHIDAPKSELAIIDLTNNKQLESWTWAWVKTNKIIEIEKIANTDYIMAENVTLNNINNDSYFTCGCCGSSFISTIKIQRKYDQDSGYGICTSCNHHYD